MSDIGDYEKAKSEKITFGSCVTLSLFEFAECFISSDGFLSSKLTLKDFSRPIGSRNYDYHNSVFKILPPIDYKIQQKLLDVLQSQKFHRNDLNDRKALILELQMNLDGELNSNMSTHSKLNGTAVLFSTSPFHLVHLASMKFVSLSKDKSESYSFTLVDFPNEKSLLKFLPCLNIQNLKSNIVMNRDVVHVCCTGLVHNRKSYLYTGYQGKKMPSELHLADQDASNARIFANLETPCRWMVRTYQTSLIEAESQYVTIGSVISLNLSERNFCLSASRCSDPFERFLKPSEETLQQQEGLPRFGVTSSIGQQALGNSAAANKKKPATFNPSGSLFVMSSGNYRNYLNYVQANKNPNTFTAYKESNIFFNSINNNNVMNGVNTASNMNNNNNTNISEQLISPNFLSLVQNINVNASYNFNKNNNNINTNNTKNEGTNNAPTSQNYYTHSQYEDNYTALQPPSTIQQFQQQQPTQQQQSVILQPQLQQQSNIMEASTDFHALKLKQGQSNIVGIITGIVNSGNNPEGYEKLVNDFEKINSSLSPDQTHSFEVLNKELKSIKQQLQDENQVFFEDTAAQKIAKEQQQQSNFSAFWKIEPVYLFKGGCLTWKGIYRFKHFVTGKYLTVRIQINAKKHNNLINTENNIPSQQQQQQFEAYGQLEATESDEPGTHFRLVPLDSSVVNKYVMKESFYRIQNIATGLFIVLREDILDAESDQQQTLRTPYLEMGCMVKSFPWLFLFFKSFFAVYYYYLLESETSTFKMRVVKFEEMWETNFILYSIPFLLNSLKLLNLLKFKSNQQRWKYRVVFRSVMQDVSEALRCIDLFVNNKLTSFIDVLQEYSHPSPTRQRIVREQHMIGMLCQALKIIFPFPEDFERFAPTRAQKKEYLELFKDPIWPQVKEYDLSTEKARTGSIEKFSEEVFGKQYRISMQIYQVLSSVCSGHSQNQEYLAKFFKVMLPHIGYGSFVCSSIQAIFCSNETILQDLARTVIDEEDSNDMFQERNNNNIDGDDYFNNNNRQMKMVINQQYLMNAQNNYMNNSSSDPENSIDGKNQLQNYNGELTFLRAIIQKFLQFEIYSIPELVKLLQSFCVVNNAALYLVQDAVFTQIIGDKNMMKKCLIQLELANKDSEEVRDLVAVVQLKVGDQLKELAKPLIEFIHYYPGDSTWEKQMRYLKCQLSLIANMCKDRNYNACFEFGQTFPLPVLVGFIISQINSQQYSLLAGILKIVMNIYIDKYPNQKMSRPNLVRIVNLDAIRPSPGTNPNLSAADHRSEDNNGHVDYAKRNSGITGAFMGFGNLIKDKLWSGGSGNNKNNNAIESKNTQQVRGRQKSIRTNNVNNINGNNGEDDFRLGGKALNNLSGAQGGNNEQQQVSMELTRLKNQLLTYLESITTLLTDKADKKKSNEQSQAQTSQQQQNSVFNTQRNSTTNQGGNVINTNVNKINFNIPTNSNNINLLAAKNLYNISSPNPNTNNTNNNNILLTTNPYLMSEAPVILSANNLTPLQSVQAQVIKNNSAPVNPYLNSINTPSNNNNNTNNRQTGILQDPQVMTKKDVYNEFTLELINTLTRMLQFGLFNERTGLKQHKQKEKNIIFRYFAAASGKEQAEVSELERIIKSLAVLLEFDEVYFEEIEKLGLKRKYVHHQTAKRDNVYAKMIKQTKNIKDILTKVDDTKKNKKINILANNFDLGTDIARDPIFKKVQGLKKILFKYANKTFSLRDNTKHRDIEQAIKIKICDFFSYLLDMRQDFFIDNIVSYFQQRFCKYKKEELDSVSGDVSELLPSCCSEVGKAVKVEKVKVYTNKYKMHSIDEVIDRPFIECLLTSFYFASNGELENKLIELIRRCSSQKTELFNNLLKMELLCSQQHKELYNILNDIFLELKNLVSDSQTWLNLENEDDYNYNRTDELVQKILKIFKRDLQDRDNLAVRQNIFKHVGGHQCLIDLIDKGLSVIENSSTLMQNLDYLQINEQWDVQELFDKLVSILKSSFAVLSSYCLNNKENQEFMYKKFFKNLIGQKKHNIGQIEFIIDMFRDNYELSLVVESQDLCYFIQMIKLHGKQYQFLEIFDILLNNVEQKKDQFIVQNLLLDLFFDDKIFQTISPFVRKDTGGALFQTDYFFDAKIDEQRYKSTFIILVSRLMRDEMEQSMITKVSRQFPACELLKYLRERTVNYRSANIKDASIIEKNLRVNAAIVDLFLFLFNSRDFDQSLALNTKLLVEIVDHETMKLERAVNYSQPQKFYLLDNFLALFNFFTENYLKDLQFSESASDIDMRKKLFKFAYTLLHSLDKVLNVKIEEIGENDRGKQLRVLAKQFDLEVPASILGERISGEEGWEEGADRVEEDEEQAKQLRLSKKKSTRGYQLSEAATMEEETVEAQTNLNRKGREFAAKNINMVEYWTHFKSRLIKDESFQNSLQSETRLLAKSVLSIQKMFDNNTVKKNQRDIALTSDDLLQKILTYIEFWRMKKAPLKSVVFVLKTLNNILLDADLKQDEEDNLMDAFRQNNSQGEKKEADKIRADRQEQLDRLNAAKIVLMLLWEEQENSQEYINQLLKFLNLMLLGGNSVVQKSIHNYFISSPASEKFFAKTYKILTDQTAQANAMQQIGYIQLSFSLSKNKKNSNSTQKIILKLLKLFQLLCEGHNEELQNYMRKQTNSKISYDLVSATVKLLISHRISMTTYRTIHQCFDTLTEFVQGPAPENQDAISNSKFLDYAARILSEDTKLFYNSDYNEQSNLLNIENDMQAVPGSSMNPSGNGTQKNEMSKKNNILMNPSSNNNNNNNDDKTINIEMTQIEVTNKVKGTNNNISSTNNKMWTHKNGSAGELLSTPISNKMNVANNKDQNNDNIINDGLNDMPDDTRNDELDIKGGNIKINSTSKNKQKKVTSSVFKSSTTGISNNNNNELLSQEKDSGSISKKTRKNNLTSDMKQQWGANLAEEERKRKDRFSIHLGELARLKYKCLLTILSILEGNDSKKELVSRIMRVIPVSVLTQNLGRIYLLHGRYTLNRDYSYDLFNRLEQKIDDSHPPDYYELIIQNGFLIYTLIKLYIRNNVLIDQADEDDDMASVIDEFKKQEETSFSTMLQEKYSIFGNVMNLTKDLLSFGKSALNEIKENVNKIGGVIQDKSQLLKEQERKEKKRLMKDALLFFKNRSCEIEIVRNGGLERVHFPKLPLCFMLSDEMKDNFNSKVDRSSHKEKLQYLNDQSAKLIEEMIHEENLRILAIRYRLLGVFAKYTWLWESLSFYLALAINSIIVASFSSVTFVYDPSETAKQNEYDLQHARLYEPRFFHNLEYDTASSLIIILGTIQCILISIFVAFFIIKRAPLIVGSLWYGFFAADLPLRKRIIFTFLKAMYSFFLLLQDFDIIYYVLQMFFVMLGLLVHPFYFAGLLSEILRVDSLVNVVKAIIQPKLELAFSILLFTIIIYYFTIFSYLFFYDQYLHEECETFWRCLFKNFDYSFKRPGALGSFLFDKKSLAEYGYDTEAYLGIDQKYHTEFYTRFIFDNLFNVILIWLVVNMIGGIVIDRFRSLKHAIEEKEKDEKQNCFICGFDRSTLDKGDGVLGFFYHIRNEHYMWNYVFYRAYLQFKETTEYNGDESYISAKIEKMDISWIPKKRTKRIPDSQDLEDKKIEQIIISNDKMKDINEQMEKIIMKQKQIIRTQKIGQQQYQQLQQKQQNNIEQSQ